MLPLDGDSVWINPEHVSACESVQNPARCKITIRSGEQYEILLSPLDCLGELSKLR